MELWKIKESNQDLSYFCAGKYTLDLSAKTYIMGILNITPDSFSDGGKFYDPKNAIKRALEIQNEGADILDIGAQSTRPGCVQITPKEELKRLLPVMEGLKNLVKIPISVDTFYPSVANQVLALGADIINDVTGFQNEDILKIAADSDCGLVIMHSGETDVTSFFKNQLKKIVKFGINKERVCFDPGIGFKTRKQDYYILNNLQKFKIDDCAMLVGLSRKRVIGEACGNPPFEKRLPGTIAANTIAITGGASILRVHDVAENVQAAQVADRILKGVVI